MDREKVILLKEIYENLNIEKNAVQNRIDSNTGKISEISAYMERISNKENPDSKIFSPRKTDTVSEEEISDCEEKLENLHSDNQFRYSLLNKLDKFIYQLELVFDDDSKCIDINSDDISNRFRVLQFLEQDRQRIARDFHDTVLQNIAHLKHMVELCSLYIDKDPIQAKLELESVSSNIKDIIESIRNTIFDLRPMSFDDLGFNELISDFLNKFRNQYKINVVPELDEISIDNNILLIEIFRILKECCSNAGKHSGCDCLWISIHENKNQGEIEINIKDNGCGFDVPDALKKANHYGLNILKERIDLLGGVFEIDSKIGEGTKIHIVIPIIKQEDFQ